MRAAWYEKQETARDVVGGRRDARPNRIRVSASGIDPGDIARAQELVEHPLRPGRIVVVL